MSASVYLQIKGELTDFGRNPVADAGKIMTLVQALGLPENEVSTVDFPQLLPPTKQRM